MSAVNRDEMIASLVEVIPLWEELAVRDSWSSGYLEAIENVLADLEMGAWSDEQD